MSEKLEELTRCLECALDMFSYIQAKKQTIENLEALNRTHVEIMRQVNYAKAHGWDQDEYEHWRKLDAFLNEHPTYKMLYEEEEKTRAYIADIKRAMKAA